MGDNGREAVAAVIAVIIMLILIVSGCTLPTQPNQSNKKLTAAEATPPFPEDKGRWVEIGTVQIVSEEELANTANTSQQQ